MRGSTASLRPTVSNLETIKGANMTQRTKPKRQRSAASAPRQPRVCPTCGVRVGDAHDSDAHYRAELRRCLDAATKGDARAQ
jgi:hypothetical protein